MTTHDKPLAAPGLTSYRCKGRYGWIMIGATDPADAMREARRSDPTARAENLEKWDGEKYQSLTQLSPEARARFDSFRQELEPRKQAVCRECGALYGYDLVLPHRPDCSLNRPAGVLMLDCDWPPA